MSDMMDDINKYAAMYDKALEDGVFDDEPSSDKKPISGTDFFGQNLSGEYDIDEPLNESQVEYWNQVANLAGLSGKIYREAAELDKEKTGEKAKRIANDHNPQQFAYLQGDGESRVTQNWGTGGKEHFDLEDMKYNLHELKAKKSALEGKGENTDKIQKEIDDMKKKIDDLSDSLSRSKFDIEG